MKNKKAAMFGLDCRALRKQFGELFLVSRQSEAPQGANGSCGLTKRAAMFGLDARIALAIFASLSLISGASLYSAIKQSQATALLVEMKEVGKAWDQFYLDCNRDLKRENSSPASAFYYVLVADELIEKPADVNDWKGPYLAYSAGDSGSAIYNNEGRRTFILNASQDVAWGDTADWSDGLCTAGRLCGLWIRMDGFKNDSLAVILDEQIDAGDGATAGRFRWVEMSGPEYLYYYEYTKIRNPND